MNLNNGLEVKALEWMGTSLKVLGQWSLPEAIIYNEYTDAGGEGITVPT